MKIGLDIDDTIVDFTGPFRKRFPDANSSGKISRAIRNHLMEDKDFWLNLPVKHLPDFEPTLVCTKRCVPIQWSVEALANAGIKDVPIYQIGGKDKSKTVRYQIDFFVDDDLYNFMEMNTSGLPCLLMDHPANKKYTGEGRVYSLNEKELIKTFKRLRLKS